MLDGGYKIQDTRSVGEMEHSHSYAVMNQEIAASEAMFEPQWLDRAILIGERSH